MLKPITLCPRGHTNDEPSCLDVSVWVNTLFNIEFKGREILVKQMENSKYKLRKGADFISIKFFISNKAEKFPYNVRVPVEMTVPGQDRHPVIFLLHVLDGIADELEVYTADGSLISTEISMLNSDHKVADCLKI